MDWEVTSNTWPWRCSEKYKTIRKQVNCAFAYISIFKSFFHGFYMEQRYLHIKDFLILIASWKTYECEIYTWNANIFNSQRTDNHSVCTMPARGLGKVQSGPLLLGDREPTTQHWGLPWPTWLRGSQHLTQRGKLQFSQILKDFQ